ncbi:uncharacterized protein PAC_07547 [Phialocephala subalpina]|uniref:Uncharacterized protein n=1 Tax=Phialocephala subalpina TaxID=576137 RepID=A0A1L7WY18_9HELO|nr:uncharacterized protein PAC_07547 [Phialocephala subalpina]
MAAMRPTTPNFNFARQAGAGPSSPPQTPTTSTFNRRHGMHITTSLPDQIKPTGKGSTFYYTPSNRPAATISPRSSSPDSSASSSAHSSSPPRSLSSSPAPLSESPPRRHTRIVAEGNFIVEEFADSDYEDWDSDDEEDVIRPHQYEDAESDRAPSVKSVARNDLDSKILSGFKNLHCEPEDDREMWFQQMRAERRRRRRSSASVQKRTLSQSIGSDTDDEDLKPVTFEGANEAGSSARRLRRKTAGERTSLLFDDPPPRIDEEDEGPESVEEVLEIKDDDEESRELRELPYWYIQEMDVDDSDDE